MAFKAAGAGLPEHELRQIRRLRFDDAAVERAFQAAYAEKSRRPVRFVMAVLLPVQFIQFVFGELTHSGLLSRPGYWLTADGAVTIAMGLWPAATVAGGLWLTHSRHFARWSQAFTGGFLLLMGIRLVLSAVPSPLGFSSMIVFAAATYTLTKLRLAYAVPVAWTVIAVFEAFSIWGLHTPAETLAAQNFPILLANLFSMVAGYTMEFAARQDFVLLSLLEEERRNVEAERQRSEALLLNILPAPIAERLKRSADTIADRFPQVSVLFADIVDFTPLAARLSAEATVELLNRVFSSFDRLAGVHGLEKIKTIGDAYMAVGGLPHPLEDHAEACVAMGLDMLREIAQIGTGGGGPLQLRVGINTGPVVAGVIGTTKFSYDLWGDTVNLASRMESHGVAGSIQVTPATYQLLREKHRFEERRLADVKGHGEMTAYVLAPRPEADAAVSVQ